MSPLLIGLVVLALICFGVLIASIRQESRVVKVVATVAALPLLAFSCFGFMASFEGSGGQFLWFRVIYVAIIGVVIAALAASWWPRKSSA